MPTQTTTKPGQNYIDGHWRDAAGGATDEVRNPADRTEIVGVYARSGAADLADALAAARRAFPAWRATPPLKRAEHLKRAHAALQRRADEIARVITLENGKTLAESRVEIDAAIAEMEFQIHEGVRLYGAVIPSAQAGVMAYTRREPLGVVALITPWNFPFNVPVRKSVPALMAGNTCLFKPASLTPGAGVLWTEILTEGGLPAGVFNCLIGPGGSLGNALVTAPEVRAVSFTGSTQVGTKLHIAAAANLTRTQLELGGKSPTIVLADADLDRAADGVAKAAFACAGQWCTSTSRVLVAREIAGAFTQKLVDRARSLRIGPGTDPQTQMGPVCGTAQLKTVLGYIESGVREGATLLTGGNQLSAGALSEGCFIEPTIFGAVTPQMTIAREEIFGPVLCVMEVDNLEHALEVSNAIEYGLAASIYTRDLAAALRFVEGIEAGLTHINMISAYKEPALPFGGFKQSGHGLPEAGRSGAEFFTDEKAVYIQP